MSGTAVAPASAAYCAAIFGWTASGAGQLLRVDKALLAAGTVTTWSLGGFFNTPNTTLGFQYSDDGTNWFDLRSGVGLVIPPLPAAQQVAAIDYETQPGVQRSYRARGSGVSAAITTQVVGLWSATATATTSTADWVYLSDPTVPGSAVQCLLNGDWQPVIHEELTLYYPIGRQTGIKSTDGTKGISGTVDLLTSTVAARHALEALVEQADTLYLQLPVEGHYITTSADRAGAVLATTLSGPFGFSRGNYSVPYIAASKP